MKPNTLSSSNSSKVFFETFSIYSLVKDFQKKYSYYSKQLEEVEKVLIKTDTCITDGFVNGYDKTHQIVPNYSGPHPEPAKLICHWCRSTDFWHSRHGRTICRVCHPPAPGAEIDG